MSVITPQNITQNLLSELTAHSPKASFTPFEKIANALKFLEDKGIPNAKNEEYKYCNLEAVLRKEFKALSSSFEQTNRQTIKALKKDSNSLYIFIENGKILEDVSDIGQVPQGIVLSDLSSAAEKQSGIFNAHFSRYAKENSDAFIAVNTAFCGNGLFIHAQKNSSAEKNLHLIYLDSSEAPAFLNYRKLFVIEEGANISITESYINTGSKGKVFCNHVSEIYCAANSLVNHDVIEGNGSTSYLVNTTQVQQETRSSYTINTFVFGGALVRNNLNIVVNGEHAETHLNGLCVSNDQQLVDNHTLVDHAKANCESNELYKGIAGGKSTLVFNGKIFVKRDSQKINAYQSSKNILMSDDATVNAKPQLEIFANDVKCSHGTSTGKIDDESMFYLKSRGIGEASAKQLLLHAFAGEVINRVKNETLRADIENYLNEALMR